MTKKDFAWLFACIVLAVALGVVIFLGVTGFFSSITYLRSDADLVLGETVALAAQENQAQVVSFVVDGSYFCGEQLSQIVQISGVGLSNDVCVRVKASVFGSQSEFDFVTSEHFALAADGYYYYDDLLKKDGKITFCTAIVLPEDLDFVSGEKFVLNLIVETLQQDYASLIWQN